MGPIPHEELPELDFGELPVRVGPQIARPSGTEGPRRPRPVRDTLPGISLVVPVRAADRMHAPRTLAEDEAIAIGRRHGSRDHPSPSWRPMPHDRHHATPGVDPMGDRAA